MTIFVFGEKANRTHENQMLRVFMDRLEDRWSESNDWIVTVANAMWNGAEIDLVCLMPSAIIVADFKNYGGKLTGTENGPWQADGVIVKGGNKANPFQQLRDNKFSVLDWLQSKALLSGRNLGHIAASIIFSNEIEDELELSSKVRSWFYPTDLNSCAVMLDSLSSPELKITRDEALEIVKRLGVQPIEWASSRPRVRNIDTSRNQFRAPTLLTGQQLEALQTLKSFVAAKDSVSFSVLGMTSTGKTRLLNDLANEVKKANKPVILLQPNRRLADSSDVESNSIYGHLYAGSMRGDDKPVNEEEQKKLKVIPLRTCDDPADCVYLLDEAHLLSDSSFSTPDGKQYGSGQLLSDFIKFADIGKGARKVVFFGDPYQIQRGGSEGSVLSGDFQKSRELKHQSLELTQLIDNTGGSATLANAVKLVSAISTQNFSNLELETDECFRVLDKNDAANEMLNDFKADPSLVWYLAETHSQTRAMSQWIRARLHGKKTLNTLEAGDLLEIYVIPDVRDAFGSRLAIQSGRRIRVESVGEKKEYQQRLSWATSNPIKFHSVSCVVDRQQGGELKVFEEFLIAEKPELEKETAVAESVWRRDYFKIKEEKECDRKQIALQGIEKPPPPPPLPPHPSAPAPDFTYARYGYAATVQHAQGMSQEICYVNCDHAAARHSEGFFRWLYSALTVAKRELVLFNFTSIHSFDAAAWKAGHTKLDSDIAVGAGWEFQPNGIASERDQQRSLPEGLEQSKDVLKSVAIWIRVVNAAERLGWRVVKAACHPYQEQYDLSGPHGEHCHLRIAYNGKNVVTAMHMKEPDHWNLLCDLARECLASNDYSPEAATLLRSTGLRMEQIGWKILSATETPYRLTLTVACNQDERVGLEINFNKQGLVSSLRPLTCSTPELVETIRSVLQ